MISHAQALPRRPCFKCGAQLRGHWGETAEMGTIVREGQPSNCMPCAHQSGNFPGTAHLQLLDCPMKRAMRLSYRTHAGRSI